ncbi:MAG: hypothetical protein HY934_04935, partial [Candidatus Firestonebacteria bacterium]|nr:hypothetical protein [Candidatus Firestonebacteria bacterium]
MALHWTGSSLLSSFAKELKLIYEKNIKKTIHSDDKDKDNKEEISVSEIILGVGNKYFYVIEGTKELIYDFNKRRIFYLDNDKKTYDEMSLFSIISYRTAELKNRMFINNALNAAKIGKNTFNPFELEILFSLENKNSEKKQIKVEVKDTIYQYIVEENIITENSLGEYSISDQYKNMFAKYLLYTCNLHPQVLKYLSENKNIFKELRYRYEDAGIYSNYVQLKLKSVTESDSDKYLISSDYSIDIDINDELDMIIKEVSNGKSNIKQLTKQQFIELADKYFDQGNYLDSILTLFECTFQTGEQSPDRIKKLVPYSKTDKQLA